MYDYHIHSDFSMDCKYSMEDMVLEGIRKNMRTLCFTDHIEFEVTEKKIDMAFRIKDYFRKTNQMKYKYFKDIEILSGVEIGMQPHLNKRYDSFLTKEPFDFVIMSIHSDEGKDIASGSFLNNKKPIEATMKYYENVLNSVKNFQNYDILGHIDLIDRYFKDFSLIPETKEYIKIVEDIFEIIISSGKGIELNTSGVRYGLKYYHPKIELLKLYKKLGGEIITIGSDAHEPKFVGYDYKKAERLLRDLGYKYIFIFRDRKKFPIQIA